MTGGSFYVLMIIVSFIISIFVHGLNNHFEWFSTRGEDGLGSMLVTAIACSLWPGTIVIFLLIGIYKLGDLVGGWIKKCV